MNYYSNYLDKNGPRDRWSSPFLDAVNIGNTSIIENMIFRIDSVNNMKPGAQYGQVIESIIVCIEKSMKNPNYLNLLRMIVERKPVNLDIYVRKFLYPLTVAVRLQNKEGVKLLLRNKIQSSTSLRRTFKSNIKNNHRATFDA